MNMKWYVPSIDGNNELKSVLSVDEIQYHDYIEVEEPVQKIEEKKVNKLEQAKKEIAEEKPSKTAKKEEKVDTDTGEITDVEEYF